MTLETLQVMIRAEIEEYQKAMNQVKAETKSTMSSVQAATSKIKNALRGVMKAVGIGLSVVALINFGKACIDLGSDLYEVQNVVDVTFGECNETIENFARNAAEQFGLSELAAKKYTSTMGAMLKSMGITGSQLEDMSIQLAGLAGDMASFYNLDSDEAFAKIRAGISGETEPLKQLGINLSVANLEQYALTQGITKSYKAMNQQEQALLRYNYLLSVTTDAAGDFDRTSTSWANQTRILALRFESLKAATGQGLINVLTPVIRVLNMVISKIQIAANAFKRFTEIVMGVKNTASSVAGVNKAVSNAAESTNSLTGATKAAGSAAKKTKEAYSGLGSFDEINSLQKSDSSSGGGGSDVMDTGLEDTTDAALAAAEETENGLNPALQKVIDKLKEIKDIALSGFWAGWGNTSLEPLKKSLQSIKESVIGIATDPDVLGAANRWLEAWTYGTGQMVGAISSIGVTIATNLVGGISKYLEQNTPRVKDFIIQMFDLEAEFETMSGNMWQAVGNIFSAFGTETGQQLTANIIGIFTDAFMGVELLMEKAGVDIADIFTRPFIDNQEKMKTALEGILEVLESFTGTVKQIVDDFVDKANSVYDESIGPLMDSIASGVSDTVGKFLDVWNSNVKPVLDDMMSKFDGLAKEHITPLLNKALEFVGAVAEGVQAVWTGVLKPCIDWIVQNVLPVLMPIMQSIWNTLMTVVGNIMDAIGGVIEILTGLIDFVVGIFTGDWDKAWNGIKEIFQGVFDVIAGIASAIMNHIAGVISVALQTIKALFSTILEAIKSVVVTIFNAIKTAISTVLIGIQTGISNALNSIKTIWSATWTGLKTTVVTIFNGIWSSIKSVINSILGGIEKMANGVVSGINTVIRAMNGLSFDIPDWVPELGGKKFGFNISTLSTVSLPRLARGGIVDGATPLIAGEAGREAIVPLENNTGWIDSIAVKLGEILSTNIINAIEDNSGSDRPIEITTEVILDGKKIATAVGEYKRRRGRPLTPQMG